MKKTIIKNRKNMNMYIDIMIMQNAKGVVFIQHGLSGYKEEKHLQKIVETFTKKHYTTVIFDATNSRGESDNDEIGITFTGHYQDLEDVINRAKTQVRYQEPFTLVGHSLGGMAVIYYTEQYPKEVWLLFPIAPVISGTNFVRSRKRRSINDFEEWEKNGYYIKQSQSGGKSLKIPFNMVQDMLRYNCYDQINEIICPVILINGDKDDSVPLVDTQAFYGALSSPKKLIILPDCGHVMRTEKNLQDLENSFRDNI